MAQGNGVGPVFRIRLAGRVHEGTVSLFRLPGRVPEELPEQRREEGVAAGRFMLAGTFGGLVLWLEESRESLVLLFSEIDMEE